MVNLAVVVPLIPRVGAMGAAAGTVAAEVFVLVAQAFMVRGELPLWRYVRAAAPFVLIGCIMAFAVRVLGAGFSALWGGPTVQGLLLELCLGALLYVVLAALWCLATHNPHFERVFGRMLRRGLSSTR